MQKAQQASYKPFDASQWSIGIVTAQFNRHITQSLYESALQRASEYQIDPDHIKTIEVAGCIEIPLALQYLAKSNNYQALLAIGCIIRGATAHFEYVARYVTDGILRVQLDQHMPIGFGILTCENETQAVARSHLGGEHLDAVLHQAKALAD